GIPVGAGGGGDGGDAVRQVEVVVAGGIGGRVDVEVHREGGEGQILGDPVVGGLLEPRGRGAPARGGRRDAARRPARHRRQVELDALVLVEVHLPREAAAVR